MFTYQPFRHPNSKQPISPRRAFTKTSLRDRWRPAVEKAGITDLRFHDLRHTAATRIVRGTGNLKIAQVLLGHTDIRTTARYAHVFTKDVADAMEATEKSVPLAAPVAKTEVAGSNVIPLKRRVRSPR